jgi:MFS family permease
MVTEGYMRYVTSAFTLGPFSTPGNRRRFPVTLPRTNQQPFGLSANFWRFFIGQLVSNLGSSFTSFAFPLIVYQLTRSAINLAISAAADFLPYLLFGLFIGVWVDRLDRRRLMIVVNWVNAVLIASIPVLFFWGDLSIWVVYLIGFLSGTVGIFFSSAEFAALPNLVGKEQLVKANGRIQASYSAVSVIGPLLAGALVVVMPVVTLLFVDAASFIIAALTLTTIQQRFNTDAPRPSTSFRADIAEGLRFIWHHPAIRALTILVALFNFFFTTVGYELVIYVKQQLHGPDWQFGLLTAASSVGVILFGLFAEKLNERFKFSQITLVALGAAAVLVVLFGFQRNIWVAAAIWALTYGMIMLFNIMVESLRQLIIPDHLLGRVKTTARMLVFSAIPLGTLVGGVVVQRTGHVGIVFSGIGGILFTLTIFFAFSAIGHAERYIPAKSPEDVNAVSS